MPELRFKDFKGIWTRSDRGERPLGALDDVNNLVFNKKIGRADLRTGYTADLSGSITDVSGDTAITSYRYPRGTHPATEVPTAQDVVVLCGTDASANKHYFQRPYWHKGNGTIDSTNWVKWGESHTTTLATGTTPSTGTLDLTAGEATDDYYNGFLLHNETRNEYGLVLDYTATGKVIKLYEKFPTDWAVGDTLTLYRHFHDNPTFSPSWTDPIVLKQGNDILASGGQGSTVGYKPIKSGYINKIWLDGPAGDTPLNDTAINGTYVSEAEVKTSAGISAVSMDPSAGTPEIDASAAVGSEIRVFAYYVIETFDGQRSLPTLIGYDDLDNSGLSKSISLVLQVDMPRLNKNVRKIHIFSGVIQASTGRTTLEYEELFLVLTSDLIDDGADWTYTEASATTPGFYRKTFAVTGNEWSSRGEDLETFLGHKAPNRTTVSFSHGRITHGRLFVTKYYDYSAALNYNDQVNFSIFASNGVSQYNKLMDLDDTTQSTIEAGDPSEVEGLGEFDGRLFIPKTRGVFWIDITYQPSQWILNTVTKEIGCDAPDSITVTPLGIIWVKSGDGVYLWRGGDPIEISANWRDTFRALTTTYVSQWWGWYDPFTRGYRFMYTANGTTLTTVYEAHLDTNAGNQLPIWTKHIMGHNVGQVTVRSDGLVFFSTGAAATYDFQNDDTDDAGTQIRPYFKLGEYSLSEDELALVTSFSLSATQTGTPEVGRQLDLILYIDSAAQKTWADVTATNSRFAAFLPVLGTSNRNRLGQTVDFEFNSNASKRGLGTAYSIHELLIKYEPKKRTGSGKKSL